MGMPALSMGLGVMGLDPLSIGVKAGMSAFAMPGVGLMGAAGAGLAAAAIPMAGMAAAGYAGHQMMTGAQDQQRLNATLGSSFNFYNQGGGRGFNRSQSGVIGSTMREMTHDMGPMGELTNMRELTEIAGKMGQMGMARNVRTAQEFNQKFKELIKTVKEVATELNTGLGQAMEFMHASKASGMFSMTDQARFARQANQVATGSGLAVSEVTAMANIGSQISRSFGGLGRQGAMGGMRAIGQIGAAVQAGVMSEEDIYNATGLSGAEGRQALASNMMSQTGSFLKSGKGRWMMASMAGANGTLDESAVQEYMMGGVDVGRSRQMAGSHLGQVGRAGFLRNEGRLRGAVMERFGANAPAIALMGWAGQRGIDINSMDDRSMLFAQRQLGMGRDELDTAVKMAQNLPRIMREQQQTEDYASVGKQRAQDMKMQGVEGMKRRFEHAKEMLNTGLQTAGQDIYKDMTNMVDRWLTNFMGQAVTSTTENLGKAWSSAMQGGVGGQRTMESVFGGGAGSQRLASFLQKTGGGAGALSAGISSRTMNWEEFAGSSGVSSMTDWLTGRGSTAKRMTDAGYGGQIAKIAGMAEGDKGAALQNLMGSADKIRGALAGGVTALNVGGGLRKSLLSEYSGGRARDTGGVDRIAAVRSVLETQANGGDAQARLILERLDKTQDVGDRARIVAGIEEGLGLGGGYNTMQEQSKRMGSLTGALGPIREGETETDRSRSLGAAMRGRETDVGGMAARILGKTALGIGLGLVAGPAAIATGLMGLGKGIYDEYTAEKRETAVDEALAQLHKGQDSLGIIHDVLQGKTEAAEQMVAANSSAKGAQEQAKVIFGSNAVAIGQIMSTENLDEGAKRRILERWQNAVPGERKGKSWEQMLQAVNAQGKAVQEQHGVNMAEATKLDKASLKAESDRVLGLGIMTRGDDGKYRIAAGPEATAGLSQTARDVMGLRAETLTARSGEQYGRAQELAVEARKKMLGMDVSELRKVASLSGSTEAAELASTGARYAGLSKRFGAAGAIGQYFGAGETREQKRELQTAWGKGNEDEILRVLSSQAGISGEAVFGKDSSLRKGIREARAGGKAASIGSLLEAVQGDDAVSKQLEKRAEAKKSPQEQMLGKIHASIEKLAGKLSAEAIAAAVPSTSITIKDGVVTAVAAGKAGEASSK